MVKYFLVSKRADLGLPVKLEVQVKAVETSWKHDLYGHCRWKVGGYHYWGQDGRLVE